MLKPKDILVITTSGKEGMIIKKYIKPVSSHIVAGTNLFSDFIAGITDVFGGRSHTYQKQLVSLYNEAIENIKLAAYEIGANCVIGLSIDMDEISGKNKSMFMLTAIGTAVIIDLNSLQNESELQTGSKFDNVSIERINNSRKQKSILQKINNDTLDLTDEVWEFITTNKVTEVYPYIIKTYKGKNEFESFPEFQKSLTEYLDALSEEDKLNLLYNSLGNEENEKICIKLSQIIKELNLFDFTNIMRLLNHTDLKTRKRGLRIANYDKAFYNKQDLIDLKTISETIKVNFSERGSISTKKQMLSSKEKEVWVCECGKNNEMENQYCSSCSKDIYGFNSQEPNPLTYIKNIEEKIEVINQFV